MGAHRTGAEPVGGGVGRLLQRGWCLDGDRPGDPPSGDPSHLSSRGRRGRCADSIHRRHTTLTQEDMVDNDRLAGATVLVTGGASGLGAAVVTAVAAAGGKPVVLD